MVIGTVTGIYIDDAIVEDGLVKYENSFRSAGLVIAIMAAVRISFRPRGQARNDPPPGSALRAA
jgi:hypothetical protein